MSTVKLPKDIVSEARIISKALIEKLAEENPDLTYAFIKNILIAQQEAAAGRLEEYHFDKN
jgi:hypothetical protein